jgi:hypothetical protein
MNTKIENHQINSELTLYDSSNAPLTVHAVNVAITKKDNEIIGCSLTFQVRLELYQRIDTNALFNLNLVVRISSTGGDFQPQPYIQIEASLKPDLLPHLLEFATNASEAAAYLLEQSQKLQLGNVESPQVNNLSDETNDAQSPSPLLFTENWLGLSVKQFQPSGEVGYQTFWAHFSRWNLSMANASQEEVADSITNFIQDLVGLGFNATTQEIMPTSIENVATFFKDLAETTANPILQSSPADQPIFNAISHFFTEDDWQFQQVPGEPILRLKFQGQQGQWTCAARAIEEQHQFIFYSICPVKAPVDRHLAIAEFLTRANYGMAIGNFELDFADGEIRYKTSIDVEGDRLTSALIKRLVYANVTMMDEYLPGIKSVIEIDVSPEEAIAQIENQPE